MRDTRSFLTSAAVLVCAGAATLAAACSGDPTSPTGVSATAALGRPDNAGPVHSAGSVLSQWRAGDTTVTTFVVDTNNTQAVSFSLGNGGKINFPYALASICDPATSSYGPGTWDSPCTAATKPITITAKTWVDRSTGKTASDFQPAMRFVPGLKSKVTLYLKDATYTRRDQMWYCPNGGSCVNESLGDPTLGVTYDQNSQWIYRVIKHFSGYTVIFS